MMRFVACLVLLALAAPAYAQNRALKGGEVRPDGTDSFGNALPDLGGFIGTQISKVKGAPNGVAGLNARGRLPPGFMPNLTVTPDMSTAQINAVLAQAASNPGSVVDFVTGAYHITRGAAAPSGTCYNEAYGLLLSGATDVMIDFNGSTLNNVGTDVDNYFHTLCLIGNTRLTVSRGFLDYKNLPFTQGTVTAVNLTPGSGSLTFSYDPSLTPSFRTVQRVEVVNGSDPRSPYGQFLNYAFNNEPSYINLPMTCSGGFCTVTNNNASQPFHDVAVNQSIIVMSQIYGEPQGGDAIRMIQNKGLTFDNVRVYSAAGMGFKAYGWITGQAAQQDISLVNGSGVYIKPGTTRNQSVNADCTHFNEVRGKVTVTGGVFNGCKDDAVNVYSFHSVVTGVTNANTFVLDHGRPWVPGDSLRFIDTNGVIKAATGVLQSIAVIGPGDRSKIQVFSPPAGVAPGWVVESRTAAADCSITNNDMGYSRGRGVLPNCRTAYVAGNRIHDMSNVGAIHVGSGAAPDEQGPAPESLTILDNTIENVNMPSWGGTKAGRGGGGLGAGAIYVRHTASNHATETLSGQLPHVVIKGNTIRGTAGAGIYASGILSGEIADNYFADWGLFPDNVFGGAAAFRGNNCAISIGSAGRLGIGLQRYGTLTNPRICTLGRGNPAPGPAGDGVVIQQPNYIDQAGTFGNGSTYSAPVETRETWTDAPGGNTATTLKSFTLQLPPLPDAQSTYTFRPGFNVAPGNLTVKDGKGNTLGSGNTACGSLGLTAQQPAVWHYANNLGTWYRRC